MEGQIGAEDADRPTMIFQGLRIGWVEIRRGTKFRWKEHLDSTWSSFFDLISIY